MKSCCHKKCRGKKRCLLTGRWIDYHDYDAQLNGDQAPVQGASADASGGVDESESKRVRVMSVVRPGKDDANKKSRKVVGKKMPAKPAKSDKPAKPAKSDKPQSDSPEKAPEKFKSNYDRGVETKAGARKAADSGSSTKRLLRMRREDPDAFNKLRDAAKKKRGSEARERVRNSADKQRAAAEASQKKARKDKLRDYRKKAINSINNTEGGVMARAKKAGRLFFGSKNERTRSSDIAAFMITEDYESNK